MVESRTNRWKIHKGWWQDLKDKATGPHETKFDVARNAIGVQVFNARGLLSAEEAEVLDQELADELMLNGTLTIATNLFEHLAKSSRPIPKDKTARLEKAIRELLNRGS